ncbi:unnamed protein product [Ectocarpus sp. 8 AP-2014]
MVPAAGSKKRSNPEDNEAPDDSSPSPPLAGEAKAGGGPRGKAKKRSEDDTGPITIEGAMPQKRFYRARAHVNPLSHNDCYEYPKTPKEMDWSVHYPNRPGLKVSIVDVGCGFGGLTVALSPLFPDKGVLGMEIRVKVCEFVRLRVEALRRENPGQYQNVSSLRTNSMLLLPHFLERHQLEKMFFCFPDPHFKAKNHRRRIISVPLLTEYAFYLRPGGLLYMITDVEELHQWHVEKAEAHPCFEAVPREEAEKDSAVKAMTEVTEEGKKVARMGGDKYWAVFRRVGPRHEDVPYTIF